MKHFKLATLIAASAMSLAAMSLSAMAEVTVSFLHKWPEPENMAYFDKAVKEFEASHPDIKIKMEAVADEPYKDKIRVLMASEQVPDVYFSWSGEFGKKFARGGRALDITDAVYNSDWKDRFSEASMGSFKYQGKLYGVPINVDGKYMLYNKKIFADNGIAEPKTYQEFLDACKKSAMKLTARSTSRMYALTCLACVIWLWQSLVEANNDGSLFNWATIVFSLCLLVVIGWSGWNAVAGWNAKETEAATAGAKDDEGSTDR